MISTNRKRKGKGHKKNKPDTDTSDQSVNKDVTEPELKVDKEKKGNSEEEMLQTNGADVHKIVNKGNKVNTTEEESEMNKDAANVKVEGSDLNKEKDSDEQNKQKQGENDGKMKKVHLQMVATMEEDELSEKNLHIYRFQ